MPFRVIEKAVGTSVHVIVEATHLPDAPGIVTIKGYLCDPVAVLNNLDFIASHLGPGDVNPNEILFALFPNEREVMEPIAIEGATLRLKMKAAELELGGEDDDDD